MLSTLNLGAVILGVGAGGLAASLLALGLSVGLTLLGLDSGADIGLVVGVISGFAVGGWVAGWRAPHTHRFHGMVTGLLLAFVVVLIARFGGSTASLWLIAWQAVVAVLVAGVAGWLAGRRRAAAR